jgi:hypothetical protein
VYAFAYLFPEGEGEAPSPFDPRYRWAVELYNLAVTKAFETEGGAQVELRSAVYELPFGRLDVTFDQDQLVWADLRLTEFGPAAELEVHGLRNRYRRPGVGAPLAAATSAADPVKGFQVAARQWVPVTALLRIDDAKRALTEGQIRASLELYARTDPEQTTIAGRTVSLEVEPSASLASGSAIRTSGRPSCAASCSATFCRPRPPTSWSCSPTSPAASPWCSCTAPPRAPGAGPTC